MAYRSGGCNLEKLIHKGAEAEIYYGHWYGKEAIFKIRKPKTYREKSLDSRLRTSRTIREASLLSEAKKVGVSTPVVYYVDQMAGEIVLQYVPGKNVKELIYSMGDKMHEIFLNIGQYIALLHRNDLIHGDLTTSNFILGERLVLIDFGLAFRSSRLEDKAIDLHLIKEVIWGSHAVVAESLFQSILDGYNEVIEEKFMRVLLDRIKTIESRRRYSDSV